MLPGVPYNSFKKHDEHQHTVLVYGSGVLESKFCKACKSKIHQNDNISGYLTPKTNKIELLGVSVIPADKPTSIFLNL